MKEVKRKFLWGAIAILTLIVAFSCKKTEEKVTKAPLKASLSPAINSVKILPEVPISREPLQAVVDPPTPGVGNYIYQWKKNGEEVMGEAEAMLESGRFAKGDHIEVEVVLFQDETERGKKRSDPVIILNSPPVVKSATIKPSPAYSRDELEAKVEVLDADGDYIRYTYQWEKASKDIPDASSATLARSFFKKGDKICYRVHVSDGESEEIVFHANAITILNSPPCILSQPSGEISEESLYEYRITAEDPDGDPITFGLSAAPEGMTVDASTGMITWKVGQAQLDKNYEFKVIVSDAEGALALQPITLKVSF
jgi:hypothetical protein